MVSPIGMWLRRELRPWVNELMGSLRQRQLDLAIEEPEDNEYDRRLHALVSLELWLRIFHDGDRSTMIRELCHVRNAVDNS